jgi:hypothetical protein
MLMLPFVNAAIRYVVTVPKRKEAMCTAKQALQLMPRSASAITLVGRVLAQSPDGYEKAKVLYYG